MAAPNGSPSGRSGRMNRSRLIAAGTSVGALIAITAGVAAANPAPSPKPSTAPASGASDQNAGRSPGQTSGQSDVGQGRDDQGGDDQWRQLPPDPSANNSGSGSTGSDFGQPQPFDPGQGSGSADTRSGGS